MLALSQAPLVASVMLILPGSYSQHTVASKLSGSKDIAMLSSNSEGLFSGFPPT